MQFYRVGHKPRWDRTNFYHIFPRGKNTDYFILLMSFQKQLLTTLYFVHIPCENVTKDLWNDSQKQPRCQICSLPNPKTLRSTTFSNVLSTHSLFASSTFMMCQQHSANVLKRILTSCKIGILFLWLGNILLAHFKVCCQASSGTSRVVLQAHSNMLLHDVSPNMLKMSFSPIA